MAGQVYNSAWIKWKVAGQVYNPAWIKWKVAEQLYMAYWKSKVAGRNPQKYLVSLPPPKMIFKVVDTYIQHYTRLLRYNQAGSGQFTYNVSCWQRKLMTIVTRHPATLLHLFNSHTTITELQLFCKITFYSVLLYKLLYLHHFVHDYTLYMSNKTSPDELRWTANGTYVHAAATSLSLSLSLRHTPCHAYMSHQLMYLAKLCFRNIHF